MIKNKELRKELIKHDIHNAIFIVKNMPMSKKQQYQAMEWFLRVINQIDFNSWEVVGIYELRKELKELDPLLFEAIKMMNYRRDYWPDKLENGEWINNAISIRLREGEMKNLSKVARKASIQYIKNKSR